MPDKNVEDVAIEECTNQSENTVVYPGFVIPGSLLSPLAEDEISDVSVPSYHSDKVQYLESGPCLSSQFIPPYHPSTTHHINYLLSSELNLVNVVSCLL